MKKSIKIFVGLLIISTIIFGIFKLIKSKYTAKIELTTTMWSSWNDRKPKETTTPKEVKIGDEFKFENRDLIIKIKDILKDKLIFSTNRDMSPYEKGKDIDVESNQRKFEVKINQETGIVTPTMDGGDIYKIKLLEVK